MLILSRGLFKSYFSPLSIYGAVWLTLFGAYGLGWVEYIPIRSSTWLLLGAIFLLFLAGTWVAASVPLSRHMAWEAPAVDWKQRLLPEQMERLLVLVFVLGLVGCGLYLKTVISIYGITKLITEAGAIRMVQEAPEFSAAFGSGGYLLLHLNMLSAVLSALYLFVFGFHWRKIWVYLMGVFALGTNLALGTRLQIFAIVIWGFFLWLYLKPHSRVNLKVAAGALVLVLLLAGTFLGVTRFTGKTVADYEAAANRIRLPRDWWFLADPYVYLTGVIPAFQEYVSVPQPKMLGLTTLMPLTKLANKVYPAIPVPVEVEPGQYIPFWFNALTYLDVYYQDWGLEGLLVAPFVIGALTMGLFVRMRQQPTLWRVYLNALLAYCLVFSIFGNRFYTTYVWEFVILGFLLTKSVIRSPASSSYDNVHRNLVKNPTLIVDGTRL